MKFNRKKGFTLSELLIVVAIIAILASVSSISYVSFKQKARDSRRAVELKEIDVAVERYFQDYFVFPDSITDLSEYFNAGGFPTDPKTGENYIYAKSGSTYCLGAKMEVLSNTETCPGLIDDSSVNYRIKGP